MAKILLVISWIGLFLTIIPPVFVLLGMVDGGELKLFMLAGTVFWFAGRVPAMWKS